VSIDSALIVYAARLPDLTAVVERIGSYGSEVEFSKDFQLAVRDEGLWRPATLDGIETGFDFSLSEISSLGDDQNSVPTNIGDRLLEFGARGDASIKLVAHVQRAICELAGAKGWIEEELISSKRMIADCRMVTQNWDAISEALRTQNSGTIRQSRNAPSRLMNQFSGIFRNGGWLMFVLYGCLALFFLVLFRVG
jgi:hypothetical protein